MVNNQTKLGKKGTFACAYRRKVSVGKEKSIGRQLYVGKNKSGGTHGKARVGGEEGLGRLVPEHRLLDEWAAEEGHVNLLTKLDRQILRAPFHTKCRRREKADV
jgi:hypothetical protein